MQLANFQTANQTLRDFNLDAARDARSSRERWPASRSVQLARDALPRGVRLAASCLGLRRCALGEWIRDVRAAQASSGCATFAAASACTMATLPGKRIENVAPCGGFVAEQRPVLIGARQQGFVELRDGVAAGDRLVADGLHKLHPDQPIRLAKAERPTAATAR